MWTLRLGVYWAVDEVERHSGVTNCLEDCRFIQNLTTYLERNLEQSPDLYYKSQKTFKDHIFLNWFVTATMEADGAMSLVSTRVVGRTSVLITRY